MKNHIFTEDEKSDLLENLEIARLVVRLMDVLIGTQIEALGTVRKEDLLSARDELEGMKKLKRGVVTYLERK